uniref:Broad-complex core protein isoform 6 n=1 Tax=Lepeophtheirus salmonis TaxID=72036 RepID=C1BVK5_LEPSM|nr:Broad-complex core protein isoform 6 [Lepeophtheirus salmonis]
MGSTETLCLRWNEFESSIKHGFSVLRSDKDFFDVTLACGFHQIKAHKLILSTCSAFFRTLIKSVPHQHPLLYLRGVDFNNLESVLCFMYSGEVRVNPEDLDQFLSLAQELQVNGLMQDQSSSEVVKSEPTLFNEVKKIEPIFEPTAPKRSLNASNIIKLKKEPSPISNPSKRISTELPDDEDSDIEVIPPSGSSTMMQVSSQEELNDVPNEEDENDEMEPEYTEEESLMNASDSSHKMNGITYIPSNS